ncbi:cytidylyltransferase domain-containing protein [Parapedobacter koreensis]|uniref:Spore coat polysaccharide biosynthesis protein SpsF n=1 Tax=Parapedobacter koreensis TaxID=332977 RepID=A0A1H7T5V6_9SPHI|nr:hypothetical protein [Parapedobacter koreensis]SEL80270.1 spore coat polysaccharide biosynthesis protein SpsF [Parapedobacter koreensis]
MRVNVFIYARFNSSRLPGKVLFKIGNETVLGICINKLKTIPNLNLIVATSDKQTDDPIAKWCDTIGVHHFRGDLQDVAERTIQCINDYPCDVFFRVNADSPFLQPFLFRKALAIISKNQRIDVVSNVYKRSFPYGIAVELINTQTYLKYVGDFNASEREHITSYFYRNDSIFNIVNIEYEHNYSQLRWVLDTPEDWARLNELHTIYPDLYNLHLEQLIRIQKFN